MRPDDRDLEDEIRGHLAISIQERIDRGEDPAAARRAALEEFGYIPKIRDSMRGIWYSRALDAALNLGQELRIGLRSLARTKTLAATVVITLALGIGANAAIFSVVRAVFLTPLVNRGEDRLIYIRQSAPGLNAANTTFSVPEINDLRAGSRTIAAFGDFSTITFTLLGLGEPRLVQAGVVSGSYFDVMGLRPSQGRLINAIDDGPDAAPVVVLTHRFWTSALQADRTVVGKRVRVGAKDATIVGVLEPSVPYPVETEIIANVVTSPHHLDATMVTGRAHRMTELFGRLKTGATVEDARAELTALHAGMKKAHPAFYPSNAGLDLSVKALRDQIAAPARTILFVLLAATVIVFVIACSNVANLILARSVRREGELAVRSALGASRGALRRSLLAESLLLCGTGAALGIVLARPLVSVIARFAARFSVRAQEATVDSSLLLVGGGLALAAAVVLAYVPRLTASTNRAVNRRLRVFATTQIAFTFGLLAGAATLLTSLFALQRTPAGFDTHEVLSIDLPTSSIGIRDDEEMRLYDRIVERVEALPDVTEVALGISVPFSNPGWIARAQFGAAGYSPAAGDEHPHATLRMVSGNYFDVLGVRLLAGRDFTTEDDRGTTPVVIVSESVARRLYPAGNALNKTLWWIEPISSTRQVRTIVGIVPDLDDEHLVPRLAETIYHPIRQVRAAGHLFVRAEGDPYALVAPIAQTIHEIAPDQPVVRPTTLEDARSKMLTSERLNATVLSGFAGVALLVAVVGVSGVLAFGVSARTREFGVRLAIGSSRRHVLLQVLGEGMSIVGVGIATGVVGTYLFASIAASYFDNLQLPGVAPVLAASGLLGAAALFALLMPASRASRVDVLQALRSE